MEGPAGGLKARQLGSDRLLLGPGRLTVHSRVDIPDWELREFRRVLVRFEDGAWDLVGRSRAGQGPGGGSEHFRYDLAPWPADRTDLPGCVIDYDEFYVAQRDAEVAVHSRQRRFSALMNVFGPVLGLLPSRAQAALSERLGLDARWASDSSRVLEYLIVVVAGAVMAITATIGPLAPGVDAGSCFLVMLVFGIDGLARWQARLEEDRGPLGFYEWLFRRKQRPRSGA